MGIFEIIVIGVSLAMDAFAVSICKGFSIGKVDFKKIFIIALYFGFFQSIMPLIGYYLGNGFSYYIKNIDHWICFILLFMIGLGMIKDSFTSNSFDELVDFKTMFFLSLATSIDALTVGITFSFFSVSIFFSIFIIGLITFTLCSIGVFIGIIFGDKFNKSGLIGGIVLIFIGLKILLEHLDIL